MQREFCCRECHVLFIVHRSFDRFHPNVYADGNICLDILQNRWSPTYDVSAILTSIQVWLLTIPAHKLYVTESLDRHYFVYSVSQSLLDEPNPNSPANSQASELYVKNRREYEKKVKAIVEQSWVAFGDDKDDKDKKAKQCAREPSSVQLRTIFSTAYSSTLDLSSTRCIISRFISLVMYQATLYHSIRPFYYCTFCSGLIAVFTGERAFKVQDSVCFCRSLALR